MEFLVVILLVAFLSEHYYQLIYDIWSITIFKIYFRYVQRICPWDQTEWNQVMCYEVVYTRAWYILNRMIWMFLCTHSSLDNWWCLDRSSCDQQWWCWRVPDCQHWMGHWSYYCTVCLHWCDWWSPEPSCDTSHGVTWKNIMDQGLLVCVCVCVCVCVLSIEYMWADALLLRTDVGNDTYSSVL